MVFVEDTVALRVAPTETVPLLLPCLNFYGTVVPEVEPTTTAEGIDRFPPTRRTDEVTAVPEVVRTVPDPFTPSSVFYNIPP